MTTDWITWALQALIIAALRIGWSALKENTVSITMLQVMLANEYVKLTAFKDFVKETDLSIHDLRARNSLLREDLREEIKESAAATKHDLVERIQERK